MCIAFLSSTLIRLLHRHPIGYRDGSARLACPPILHRRLSEDQGYRGGTMGRPRMLHPALGLWLGICESVVGEAHPAQERVYRFSKQLL